MRLSPPPEGGAVGDGCAIRFLDCCNKPPAPFPLPLPSESLLILGQNEPFFAPKQRDYYALRGSYSTAITEVRNVAAVCSDGRRLKVPSHRYRDGVAEERVIAIL